MSSTYTVNSSNYNVNDEYYLQSEETLNVEMTVIRRKNGSIIGYVGYGVLYIDSIDGVNSLETTYFNSKCTLYNYAIDGSKLKKPIIFNKVLTNTIIEGYFNGGTLTVYPAISDKIKIKINNSYIDGVPKIKIDGNWTDGSAYVKINGSWRN